jgi:hypothetical protein
MTDQEIGGQFAQIQGQFAEVRSELRSLKLDIREARLEAKEQYNRFRLLIWLPIITGALQVLAAILHR